MDAIVLPELLGAALGQGVSATSIETSSSLLVERGNTMDGELGVDAHLRHSKQQLPLSAQLQSPPLLPS